MFDQLTKSVLPGSYVETLPAVELRGIILKNYFRIDRGAQVLSLHRPLLRIPTKWRLSYLENYQNLEHPELSHMNVWSDHIPQKRDYYIGRML